MAWNPKFTPPHLSNFCTVPCKLSLLTVQCVTAGREEEEEEEVTFQSSCGAFSSLSILQQNEAEIKRGVTSGAVSVGAKCGASQRHRNTQKRALDPIRQKMLLCNGTIVGLLFVYLFLSSKSAIVVVLTWLKPRKSHCALRIRPLKCS